MPVAVHWRKEARDFRSAVDRELALNLGTFEFNQLQQKCTAAASTNAHETARRFT